MLSSILQEGNRDVIPAHCSVCYIKNETDSDWKPSQVKILASTAETKVSTVETKVSAEETKISADETKVPQAWN